MSDVIDIHPHVISPDTDSFPLKPLGGTQSSWSLKHPLTYNELIAAMGLNGPDELRPYHVSKRIEPNKVMTYELAYRFLNSGDLLDGSCHHPILAHAWSVASPETFAPVTNN